MFLVAGYARYSRPYVWVRSNHERLVQFSSDNKEEKDFPLQLKTTSNWLEGGTGDLEIFIVKKIFADGALCQN